MNAHPHSVQLATEPDAPALPEAPGFAQHLMQVQVDQVQVDQVLADQVQVVQVQVDLVVDLEEAQVVDLEVAAR